MQILGAIYKILRLVFAFQLVKKDNFLFKRRQPLIEHESFCIIDSFGIFSVLAEFYIYISYSRMEIISYNGM